VPTIASWRGTATRRTINFHHNSVSKKILGRGSKYTGNEIRIDDQEYLILREEEEANDNSF
jgi:co-chaperonin GroES (HSP10)